MRHMIKGQNIALSTTRATETSRGWEHVLCSTSLIQHHTVSLKEVNYLFPLWIEPEGTEERRLPNLSPTLMASLARDTGLDYQDGLGERQGQLTGIRRQKPEQISLLTLGRGRGDLENTFGPRDAFDWMYAILHSPMYRTRYATFLKSEFPHIPMPNSKALFVALIPIGTQLTALHELDVANAKILSTSSDMRLAGSGVARIEKGYPKWANGRVTINSHRWFEEVPEEAWNFHIGGYRVCEKWLKDRRGRLLSTDDIELYQRVVVALRETRRLMTEIDAVIGRHGGWPNAFSVHVGSGD